MGWPGRQVVVKYSQANRTHDAASFSLILVLKHAFLDGSWGRRRSVLNKVEEQAQ